MNHGFFAVIGIFLVMAYANAKPSAYVLNLNDSHAEKASYQNWQVAKLPKKATEKFFNVLKQFTTNGASMTANAASILGLSWLAEWVMEEEEQPMVVQWILILAALPALIILFFLFKIFKFFGRRHLNELPAVHYQPNRRFFYEAQGENDEPIQFGHNRPAAGRALEQIREVHNVSQSEEESPRGIPTFRH